MAEARGGTSPPCPAQPPHAGQGSWRRAGGDAGGQQLCPQPCHSNAGTENEGQAYKREEEGKGKSNEGSGTVLPVPSEEAQHTDHPYCLFREKKKPLRALYFLTAPGLGVSSAGAAAARFPRRRLLLREPMGEGEEKGKVGKK